jgi:hypothetical protein
MEMLPIDYRRKRMFAMNRAISRLTAYGISGFGGHLSLLAYQQKSFFHMLGGIACFVICLVILASLKNSKQEAIEDLRLGPLIKTAGVCLFSAISVMAMSLLWMPENSVFTLALTSCFFAASLMGAVVMGYFSKREELLESDH